ncbi:MAG: hypothetical protein WDN69_16165 [Aliidongia sp.]
MSRAPKTTQNILMLIIILPFWTSFLLRVYALEGIIRENGLLNSALLWAGVIDHPLKIMRTGVAVYLGIVYSYLPFMVLPLYATLEKLDNTLLEAASDLASRPGAPSSTSRCRCRCRVSSLGRCWSSSRRSASSSFPRCSAVRIP